MKSRRMVSSPWVAAFEKTSRVVWDKGGLNKLWYLRVREKHVQVCKRYIWGSRERQHPAGGAIGTIKNAPAEHGRVSGLSGRTAYRSVNLEEWGVNRGEADQTAGSANMLDQLT